MHGRLGTKRKTMGSVERMSGGYERVNAEPPQRLMPDRLEPQGVTLMTADDSPEAMQDVGDSALTETVADLGRKLQRLEQEALSLRHELEEARRGPSRKRLRATRNSITHKFAVGQHEGYMTVGLYEDGEPGEVFLTMAKEGSTIGGLMDAIGILTSLALQYGVPLEALAHKFEYVSFEPSGWTGDPNMRRASSVVDYIFRWLGMRFSERYREAKLGTGETSRSDRQTAEDGEGMALGRQLRDT